MTAAISKNMTTTIGSTIGNYNAYSIANAIDDKLYFPTINCSFKDEKFANIALEEAKKSDVLSQHGCVAVLNGKIIARGHNSSRAYSGDGFLRNTCSCHAEVDVLRKLYHQFKPTVNFYDGKSDSDSDDTSSPSSSPPKLKPRSRRRRNSRKGGDNSSFNLQNDRWCFLSEKYKPVCGT